MTTIASRSIEIYTTTDGRDFENYADATAHQAKVDASASIDAFVASRGLEPGSAASTRLANSILDWIAFNASYNN